MNFAIIAAMDQNRGIGKNNALPWRLSADLRRFKEITEGGTVIMGRKTWESLPEAFRPLKNRLNIVVSRGEVDLPEGVLLAHSLDESLALAQEHAAQKKAFVIGGATLYAEAIRHPACNELHLTFLDGSFGCDAFFPEIPPHFNKFESSDLLGAEGLTFHFAHYSRVLIQ